MPVSAAMRRKREQIVREHMESENRLDFETTLKTFAHPRYELIATGQVFDGEEAVRQYYAASRAAFPDQRNAILAVHHADDAVIVEFDLLGTPTGKLRSLPPTTLATVSTASVLATPGTPSSSRCPRASSPTSIRSTSRS